MGYLPRLPREHYQADAVGHWTLTIFDRKRGWLTDAFHVLFRELMFHAAVCEGLNSARHSHARVCASDWNQPAATFGWR